MLPDQGFQLFSPNRVQSASGCNPTDLQQCRLWRNMRIKTASGSKKHVFRNNSHCREIVSFDKALPVGSQRIRKSLACRTQIASAGRERIPIDGRRTGPEIFIIDCFLGKQFRADDFSTAFDHASVCLTGKNQLRKNSEQERIQNSGKNCQNDNHAYRYQDIIFHIL